MAKNRQNKPSNDQNDFNNYEITGSVSAKKSEANAIIDKSMEAIENNISTQGFPEEKVPRQGR